MLRTAAWVLRILVFLLLLGLAVKNSGTVTLHFFFANQWDMPLVLLLLVVFGVGALIGSTVALTTIYRQRRHIERLQRELSVVPAPAPSIPDPSHP